MISKILLAVDGSAAAKAATTWVRALTSSLSGVAVTVLNVQPIAYTASPGYLPASVYAELELDGKRLLEEASEILGSAPASVRTVIRRGDPASEIIDLSKDHDLVVVGSRGLNPMAQLVIGSVSDRVTRFAKCPVTVIHH